MQNFAYILEIKDKFSVTAQKFDQAVLSNTKTILQLKKAATTTFNKFKRKASEGVKSSSKLAKSVKGVSKPVVSLKGGLKELATEQKKAFSTKPVGEYVKAVQASKIEVSKLKNELKLVFNGFNTKAKESIKTGERFTNQIKKAATPVTKLKNELKEVTKTAKQAMSATNSVKVQKDVSGRLRDERGRFAAAPRSRKIFSRENLQSNAGNNAALAGGALLGISVSEAAKLSDKIGDVRRNALMSKTEFAELKKELNGLDTRTSTANLLDIAKVGGKLGVPKKELAGFTRVVDMATVSLGDEFGGSASAVAEKLGVVKNLFAQTKNLDYGTAMAQIGSSVNALGKQGKNSAPNVLEFTSRIGQLGKLAPSVAQTMALGATLEEANISAEIASGGVTNLLTLAGQKPTQFASLLELTNKQFKDLLNNDPGNLILRLAQRFKGVKNDEVIKTLQGIGVGSQESIKTLLALSSKTDTYQARLKVANEQMKKATDLGVDYNIMNQTMAARLDKAKKAGIALMVTLGNKLSPALDFLTEKFKQAAKFIQNNWSSVKPVLFGVGVALALVAAKMVILNIAMAANPVGAIITGIALLSAGIYAAYQRFKPFRGVVNSTWQDLKNFADGIRQDFTPALNDIKNAFGGAGNSAFGWGEIVGLVGLAVRGVINRLLIILKGFTTFFAVMIDGIIATAKFWCHAFAGIFALITGDVTGFKQYFNRAIGAVGDFFVRTFQKVKRFFGGFISGFVDRMGQALEIVGLVDSKQRELATKKTRDFFGLDEQKKKAKTPQPGGLVKASAQNKKSPLAGTLNSFGFGIPETQNKIKVAKDKPGASTPKSPGFKNNLANLSFNQSKTKGKPGTSTLQNGLEQVSASGIKEKNYNIKFESFIKGGLNLNTTNVQGSVNDLEARFTGMFLRVINSIQQ